MREFVQKFRRTATRSRDEERLLIEEFKRGMNRTIRQKLIELECLSGALNSGISK